MKLSHYAKKLGLKYLTVWKMYKQGKIPGAYQIKSGTIIVPDDEAQSPRQQHVVVYARVSSPGQKDQLKAQTERLCRFCEAAGMVVNEVVSEVASGLNDDRPKLGKIFRERKATKLVVEHKDRLTRFGFNHIKTLFPECEIVVVNPVDNDEKDLMQDFVSLVTCFCARLYGLRRSRRKTEKLIEQLKNAND